MPTEIRMPLPPHARAFWRTALAVLILATFGQAWLALNPGYFSHDELTWGATASVDWRALPWLGWFDVQAFQWRPLTFNLWLPISHALFESPRAWHTLWVLLGSGIAAALAALLRRLGASSAMAIVGGVAFALNPYAVYVHGWVATLADLLWVAIAVALAHAMFSMHRRGRSGPGVAAIALAATAAALLAKESAVVLPALLGLTWLLAHRSRTLAWATMGSGLAVLGYLSLRLGVLMDPPVGAYATSPLFVHRNLAAFALFPFRPSSFEVQGFLPVGAVQLIVSSALWMALLLAMRRTSPRLAALVLIGGPLALAPTLPLEVISNQYAYGASAWVVACVTLACGSLSRSGRVVACLMFALVTWHGFNMQRQLHDVGARQAVFQPALRAVLAGEPSRLSLYATESDAWIYRRLTQEIVTSPAGAPVVFVATPGEADWQIAPDGALVKPGNDPLRP